MTILSPSGWHDTARNRDAGHDKMQLDVYDFLKKDWLDDGDFIEIEKAFVVDGRVRCFADIAICEQQKDTDKFAFITIEIKPKIDSVGAIIRQCKAFEVEVKQVSAKAQTWPFKQNVVVVPASDPNLDVFVRAANACSPRINVATWDGERLSNPRVGDRP